CARRRAWGVSVEFWRVCPTTRPRRTPRRQRTAKRRGRDGLNTVLLCIKPATYGGLPVTEGETMANKGHGGKLRRTQEQTIAALLDQPTLSAAAETAGVSERALRDWLKLPAFQAAYADARRAVLERTVVRLLSITGKAVETLKQNLDCGD